LELPRCPDFALGGKPRLTSGNAAREKRTGAALKAQASLPRLAYSCLHRTPIGKSMTRATPVFRFRPRVTDGARIAVGPGKIALLEAIEKTGSITAAAKSLDMSYRRAWVLLDELNRSLRVPAVDSSKGGQHGGGSALTKCGHELIGLYRRIESTAESASRADIKRLMGMLAR
jgi:molybdate transport system regulatory protein